jgi:hypothetical protein
MARGSSRLCPATARHVGTYDDLMPYIDAFVRKGLPLVLLVGRPGTGKSEITRQKMEKAYGEKGFGFIDGGKVRPIELYKEIYAHRGKPLVIDDSDPLLDDKEARGTIKQITELRPRKTVSWKTNTPFLEEVPKSFETDSSVIVIANEWNSKKSISRAIEDRASGSCFYFNPSNGEVYNYCQTWYRGPADIPHYIYDRLDRLEPLSCRWFDAAKKQLAQGLDWKRVIDDNLRADEKERVAWEIVGDPKFNTKKKRVDEFIRRTGLKHTEAYRRIGDIERQAGLEKKPKRWEPEPEPDLKVHDVG